MVSARGRWLASERIALKLLEDEGYTILETHKKIVIDGVEVSEVDALVRGPDGSLYAVEVKAGKLDVTGVRQAYTNALLLNAKPLVVCRGYADDAARTLADKLGVRVIVLSDMFLADLDELELVVREALDDVLGMYLEALLSPEIHVKPQDAETIIHLSRSSSLEEFAKRLGATIDEAAKKLAELKKRYTVFRRARGFMGMARIARLLVLRMRVEALIDSITRLERTLNP